MKKLLCGFAWIFFGIAMILAESSLYIPIIEIPPTYLGAVSAIIGLVIVIKESRKP